MIDERDDLERRLRTALRDAPLARPRPAAAGDLLATARRRRARRRTMGLGAVVSVLVAAGVTSWAVRTAGGPATRAAGPSAPSAASPSTGRPSRTHAARPGSRGSAVQPFRSVTTPSSAVPCVRVRVGGGPAECAGTYSTVPTGALHTPRRAAPAVQAPFGRAVEGSSGNGVSGGAARGRELRLGQTVHVDLPRLPDLAWGRARVSEHPASAAATTSPAVLRPVQSPGSRPRGASSATFEAVRRGAVTLVAGARRACPGAPSGCGPVTRWWSLSVEVRGP